NKTRGRQDRRPERSRRGLSVETMPRRFHRRRSSISPEAFWIPRIHHVQAGTAHKDLRHPVRWCALSAIESVRQSENWRDWRRVRARCRRPWCFVRKSRAGRNDHQQMQESGNRAARSEEHTSELQSRVDLVCRLLLEKKKQTK